MLGVIEMLETTNFTKCIASRGPILKIRHALQVSRLAPFFGDNIFSSYEVGSWKPEPGLFQFAANTMGYLPNQCIVVEDSEIGIQAATAAGMKAFHYVRDSDNSFCQSDDRVIFDNFSQLPQLLADFA